ncbi:MAG: type II secretion system F family protein [Gemmatimonadetes bacterium]|nr:type II secretion system F family protein [Gemmatimonadota bacterium]
MPEADAGRMPHDPSRWRYRAADASGRETTGTVVARSADEARAQVRQQALWLIALDRDGQVSSADDASAQPIAIRDAAPWRVALNRWWRRVSGAEAESLAVSLRALGSLLAAGVPLDRALGAVAGDAIDATHADASVATPATIDDGHWAGIFRELQARIREGVAMSAAVAAFGPAAGFPVALAPSLAAAEESGTLAEVVARAATALEAEARTRAAIRASLTYPAVLAVAATVATSVILLVVVPRFALLLDDAGVALPWSTSTLLAFGRLLARWGWALPLVAGGALWWWRVQRADPDWRARQDARRLRWPVVGPLERQREGARYAGTLAMALDAGVPLLRAMALARGAVSNRSLATACAEAEAAVRDGRPLAASLATVLPPLTLRLLEAGERAGALAAMATRAAAAADDTVTRAVARTVALVEPLLILGFGGVVGFVALALLQAIYGLNAATF